MSLDARVTALEESGGGSSGNGWWYFDTLGSGPPILFSLCPENKAITRIHSSKMRTAHLLTVSQHALPGGVPAWGCTCLGGVPAGGCICHGEVTAQLGVPAQGVYLCRRVYLPRGCTYQRGRCTCQGAVAAQALPPEQNYKQVEKHYLVPYFVWGRL